MKELKKSLLLGAIASILPIYVEIKWLDSAIGVEAFQFQRIVLACLYQIIMFSGIFLTIFLTRNHLRQNKMENRHLTKKEVLALAVQVCSAFSAAASLYFFTAFLVTGILGLIFIGIGITSYRSRKSSLAVSFMVWGVELYIIACFYTVMIEVFSVWSDI